MHADATEMPDAIEIVFQSALQLGRRGGVSKAQRIPFQS
jgi:hypothetical protein